MAAAERHERVWIFLAMLLLGLLLLGTLFFVVLDYGTVVKTAGYEAAGAPLATRFTPGVVRTGPDSYAVHMLAAMWHWTPAAVHVPQGATVTFFITSADVVHGFEIAGTTVNVTAIPGVVGSVTYSFTRPGTFTTVCNEYCGIEHQSMMGSVVVAAARPR